MIYDITPPITPTLGVWPGDTPMSRELLCEIEKGDTVALSTLKCTVHLGAHADGPNHYSQGAPGIGERPLRYYIGRCQVVQAPFGAGQRLVPDAIDVAARARGGEEGEIRLTYRQLSALIEEAVRNLR